MHDIAQKQIFLKKPPELDPNPDLVVKFPDPAKKVRIRPDPDPQHCCKHSIVNFSELISLFNSYGISSGILCRFSPRIPRE